MASTRRKFIHAGLGLVGVGLFMPSALMDAAWAQNAPSTDLLAQRVGNFLYIRIPGWSDNQDAVQRWLVGHKGNFVAIDNEHGGNGTIDFFGEKLIASSVPKETPLDRAYNQSTLTIRSGGDEGVPIRLANGMYVGGGHGFTCRQVTVPRHGLTLAAIGKRYTNAAAQEYVLADIVDANTLKFFRRPAVDGELWTFYNNAIGDAPTPVGGGAPLAVTAEVSSQLWPLVQNYTCSAGFAGGREISRDAPVSAGPKVVLSERYGIAHFPAVYEWLVANAGKFTARPHYGDPAIATQLEMEVSYAIDWTGMAMTSVAVLCRKPTALLQMHAAQVQQPFPTKTSRQITFVPGTKPINERSFATGVDITSGLPMSNFERSTWKTADAPAACVATLVTEDGAPRYGLVAALRNGQSTNIGAAGYSLFLSPARKSYLVPAYGLTLKAGQRLESRATTGSLNPAHFGAADFAYLAPEADGYLLYAYKSKAATGQWLPVDRRLLGKAVTLQRTSDGGKLHSARVEERGVLVDFAAETELELHIE